MQFQPLPKKFGVGIMSLEKLDLPGYRYEHVGRYHNYYVTKENWEYPISRDESWGKRKQCSKYIIDGFSPNLNKELHVGHLRNLALAHAFSHLYHAYPVAMLGASLGVKKKAIEGWKWWTNFLHYKPDVYYDVLLPNDVLETRSENDGTELQYWDGPNGEVPVVRSDGKRLYTYHDLVFAKEVGPTHYVTGHEQKQHFESLGLGDKHLPMGLVLGTDGKKMKSRDGEAFLAVDAMNCVKEMIGDVPEPDRLAWNILAWNFLHVSRENNVKFDAEKWVKPEAHGMYVSYTYARVCSALGCIPTRFDSYKQHVHQDTLLEKDVLLLGFSQQFSHYRNQSMEKFDLAPIANYSFELAREINFAYNQEKIRGGREAFFDVIQHATWQLGQCLFTLGMFQLRKI